MTSLTLGICTHKRPAMLDRLLGQLQHQQTPVDWLVDVVVVDNDPAHSAHDVLTRWQHTLQYPLRFVSLPDPNISLARNQVLRMAQGEWLLLVDDDQYPEDPTWVARMVQAIQVQQSDVVFGPILPVYEPGAPAWITRGQFFDQPRYVTGTPVGVHIARGGNVILRRACLPATDEPFSVRYGKTGGEDSLFFRELEERGCRITWNDEAVIYETVPADRATARWLFKRSYRIGQTYIRTQCEGLPPAQALRTRLWLGLRAVVLLCASVLLLVVSLPACSRTRSFEWVRKLALQLGKLSSFAGLRYVEYK